MILYLNAIRDTLSTKGVIVPGNSFSFLAMLGYSFPRLFLTREWIDTSINLYVRIALKYF